jgi:pteridine reductase
MTRKTVLVTGAGVRIGAAIARDLHAAGMDVIIHYRRSAGPARELAGELNAIRSDSAYSLGADLMQAAECESLIEAALQCTGHLDVLVNNASQFYATPVGETTPEQWEEIVTTNLKAPFFLAQACAPELRARRGCIVNITDIHGQRPLENFPVYSAAKAGLIMLTQALARELAPQVRVNGVSPGPVMWPEGMPEETKRTIIDRVSLKRQGRPEEVSECVRFLIEEAGYVTGQVLTVDGGRTLYS